MPKDLSNSDLSGPFFDEFEEEINELKNMKAEIDEGKVKLISIEDQYNKAISLLIQPKVQKLVIRVDSGRNSFCDYADTRQFRGAGCVKWIRC